MVRRLGKGAVRIAGKARGDPEYMKCSTDSHDKNWTRRLKQSRAPKKSPGPSPGYNDFNIVHDEAYPGSLLKE